MLTGIFRFILTISAGLLLAQQPPSDSKPKEDPEKEDGIPVTSAAVKQACAACHASDEKGRMTRISYRRTTPEGWQQTIKRMVTLNNVKMEPAVARQVVRDLSNSQGLAPEEAKPGAFEVEHRLIDYKYTADNDTEQTCIKCHSFGRILLQRRAKSEWELLMAMHRGYYPLIDFQAFRRMGPMTPPTPPPPGPPPDMRHPMDKAVAHLSTAFPLKTAAWSAWSANVRQLHLEGRWSVSGYQAGKGPVFGDLTIKQGANPDEVDTTMRLIFGRNGEVVERKGKAVIYTGFQWRGRSMIGGAENTSLREVMFVERSQREMSGRWFMGAYEETGIDVKLTRIAKDVYLGGTDRRSLQQGANATVKIYGANFNGTTAAQIDFGAGVSVKRVASATDEMIAAEVEIAKGATIGNRDLLINGSVLEKALVVYDKVDSVKVRPGAGLSRLGGNRFPKQYTQFEAIGYSNGHDGKPDTPDDLELGALDVAWSMEEYTATFGDDDKEFVGSLDANGFFTPSGDGPNPSRKGNRNNVGDVWIVATYSKSDKPVRGRAHLLVSVPVYMRFDQPEISQ